MLGEKDSTPQAASENMCSMMFMSGGLDVFFNYPNSNICKISTLVYGVFFSIQTRISARSPRLGLFSRIFGVTLKEICAPRLCLVLIVVNRSGRRFASTFVTFCGDEAMMNGQCTVVEYCGQRAKADCELFYC